MPYKLSAVLRGHELDIRAVCPSNFPDGGILTASRDRTTRLWVPDKESNTFTEGLVLAGHENFISAVCVLPATEAYPHGLIATGGHDKQILIWNLESTEPLHTLTGHTGAVCSLVAGKFGTLLSGSWDNTAKVWISNKCVMTLQGHEAAVWAVDLMPEHGLMLTGSADKTIKMWRAGSCEKTFSGHTDCVRGLAVLSMLEFLSCSNDCTIRRWLTTGECLQVYTGHSSFIYNLSVLQDESGRFASVGEDRTLRIWEGGECSQTITLPAQSVWCVTCLANGDIVTGSSDGVGRVFTSQAERFASPEEIKLFEEEVAKQAIPAQASGQIGDIKLEQLPGPEALLRPGKKSGQTIMVRRGQTVECHQWNDMEGKWDKVGEVVGAPGTESSSSSNKSMYKGKEYDIIFNVEITEGKPPLKLPFNYGDDPWVAAHNFLAENDLSQLFLDQVVDFILKNTKDVTIGQTATPASDPFTGGNRYMPGSSATMIVPGNQLSQAGGGGAVDPFTGSGSYRPSYTDVTQSGLGTSGADPFTGGSSYRPAQSTQPQQPTPALSANQYFPKNDFVTFDKANNKAILSKVEELNSTLDSDQKLDTEDLQHLTDLLNLVTEISENSKPSEKHLLVLSKALQWPFSVLFPVLDILRLAIRHPFVATYFCGNGEIENIVERLLQLIRQESPAANVLLVFRTLANLFPSSEGSMSLLKYREKIVEMMLPWITSSNKNIKISLCTVLLNFSVLFRKFPDFGAQTQCFSTLANILQSETDNEARFRSLVAIGNMMFGNTDIVSYGRSLELEGVLQKLTTVQDPPKVGDCAKNVLLILKE